MLWTRRSRVWLTYIGFCWGLCTAAAVAGLNPPAAARRSPITHSGMAMGAAIFVLSVVAVSLFTMIRMPVETGNGFATLLAAG